MNILNKVKHIEKQMEARRLNSKVHFFDTKEELKAAEAKGLIGKNDVCFIDDIWRK